MAYSELSFADGDDRAPAQGLHHHNRDLALQKYILLQEQHEGLRSHLNELLSPLSPTSTDPYSPNRTQHGAIHHIYPATATTTPSASPTRSSFSSSSGQSSPYASRSSSSSRTRQHRRRSLPPTSPTTNGAPACSLETLLDETTLIQVAAEEAQLSDVNESIKRTLTELLNCETVRRDGPFRTWVQCRLMDAEKELRTGRRRRGACA
jgi:hypothetical protein